VAEETKYADLTVEQLGEELEKRGLKKSGKKDELIARLEDDDTAQGGTAPETEAAPEEEAADEKPRRRRSAETAPAPMPATKAAAPLTPEGEVMVRARARYVRSAPRKARLVMEHIRGRPVEQARAILGFTPRAVSGDILKLLDSAVANAESNYELAADELRVQKAYVDEGPTIKRYRPRALGRATRINKRTSHMTIELTTQNEA
jgi:large subunit ribosomal protein L22